MPGAPDLASDRKIRRNASQQFHVTRHCRDCGRSQRGTRVIGGSAAAASETLRGPCHKEPLTAVWAGTLNSWMMRRSFRFRRYRIGACVCRPSPTGNYAYCGTLVAVDGTNGYVCFAESVKNWAAGLSPSIVPL
jgi:hypothetical protein